MLRRDFNTSSSQCNKEKFSLSSRSNPAVFQIWLGVWSYRCPCIWTVIAEWKKEWCISSLINNLKLYVTISFKCREEKGSSVSNIQPSFFIMVIFVRWTILRKCVFGHICMLIWAVTIINRKHKLLLSFDFFNNSYEYRPIWHSAQSY